MPADSLVFARRDPASLWAARQIGIKDLDSVQDVWQINDYLDENEPPWERETRLANEQRDQIAADLENLIATNAANNAALVGSFQQSINDINARNGATIQRLQDDAFQREQGLRSFIDQQAADFDRRFSLQMDQFNLLSDNFNALNLQYNELNAANAEQNRLAANAAKASVPAPNQPAELPTVGDSRETERMGKNNNLSQLTILSGLGSQGGSQSGLQLA